MSNLLLDRPAAPAPTSVRAPHAAVVGSYVDSDGVRRAPARAGSYTGTRAGLATRTGTYTGTGTTSRTPASYVRAER